MCYYYIYCISSPAGCLAHFGLGFNRICTNFSKLPETSTGHLNGSDLASVQSEVSKCKAKTSTGHLNWTSDLARLPSKVSKIQCEVKKCTRNRFPVVNRIHDC